MTGVFSATCAAYEEIVRASCCTVSGQSSVVRTLAPQVKGSGDLNPDDANFPPFPLHLVTPNLSLFPAEFEATGQKKQ